MRSSQFSRRHFLAQALKTSGVVVAVSALSGCDDSNAPSKSMGAGGQFLQGVASGDPQADAVILWTRITPNTIENKSDNADANKSDIEVQWEIAEDSAFTTNVMQGLASTNAARDYTFKVDAQGLNEGKRYFYRFSTSTHTSPTGQTKTLPVGAVASAKFAVVSCSNYPAGHFNVYGEIAKQTDLDAVLHLGDYLYEYERGGYASENAAALGREVLPAGEIITLADYRTRYAQYHTDPQLQAAHASAPFICVWDDHEVTNDAWREGAENHNERQGVDEGLYTDRVKAALQAYAEWMPIRPPVDDDIATLSRHFEYGTLVNLSMLDTRLVARDQQLNMASYFSAAGFDSERYFADVNNSARTLLGTDQLQWLLTQLASGASWQVLGQQVLMGVMELPGAAATAQMSLAEYARLGAIATKFQADSASLSEEETQDLQANAALLQLPNLPYNQDAWDGYPAERKTILEAAKNADANLVVLAGDTHNAWANNLTLNDEPVGLELATASVTSPGLETFLGLDSMEAAQQAEAGLVGVIDGLRYTNLRDRGYLTVAFTPDEMTSEFTFIDTIASTDYNLLSSRKKALSVPVGAKAISAEG